MACCFSNSLLTTFDDTVTRVTEERKKEGFGILTETDVRETVKTRDENESMKKDFKGR